MRMILHDWPESAGLEILRHLREAASPETELIIIETLLEYPCLDTTVDENVPGMRKENPAPAPLLPNYGHANIFPYLGDIQVCLLITIAVTQYLSQVDDGSSQRRGKNRCTVQRSSSQDRVENDANPPGKCRMP